MVPRILWNEERYPMLATVLPRVSPDHRLTFLKAIDDLARYNLTQPAQAMANWRGVAIRRRQWNKMAGGRAGKRSYRWLLVGAIAGALGGFLANHEIPPVLAIEPALLAVMWVSIFAILGAAGGHVLSSPDGYTGGMMQVIANERRSVIRPEMVTGQVEIWIPKVLVAWRSHEWRYRDGKPYMWLMLPGGERLQDLRSTLDYLQLPNDLHRAQDAAVYAQRTLNRLVSESALDFADVEAGKREGDDRLKELMPYLVAGCIVLCGILLVIMTS